MSACSAGDKTFRSLKGASCSGGHTDVTSAYKGGVVLRRAHRCAHQQGSYRFGCGHANAEDGVHNHMKRIIPPGSTLTPDFLAIGLGTTNMVAMLFALAHGKKTIGVELRGDPFLVCVQALLTPPTHAHAHKHACTRTVPAHTPETPQSVCRLCSVCTAMYVKTCTTSLG